MSKSDDPKDEVPEPTEVRGSIAATPDLGARQAAERLNLFGAETTKTLAAIAAQAGQSEAVRANYQLVLDSVGSLAREVMSRAATDATVPAFADTAQMGRVYEELARTRRLAVGDNLTDLARELTKSIGGAALVSWTGSRLVESHLQNMGQGILAAHELQQGKLGIATVKLLDDLKVVSAASAGLTDWVVRQREASSVLSAIGSKVLDSWNRGLLTLQPEASASALRAFVTTGRASLGITGADILTSSESEEELVGPSVEAVTAEVLQPWESGRLEIARELRAALGRHDVTLPDLLDGAWDDITRRGPAAAVKAANCVIEVMDRVLRAAAPDAAVVAWHASSGRPLSDWEGVDPTKGHPPHNMRVRYLMAGRGEISQVVQHELEALLALRAKTRQRLQAVKHASKGNVATVRALIMATENFLMSLFLEG